VEGSLAIVRVSHAPHTDRIFHATPRRDFFWGMPLMDKVFVVHLDDSEDNDDRGVWRVFATRDGAKALIKTDGLDDDESLHFAENEGAIEGQGFCFTVEEFEVRP
jgi:hypothetical protein